MYNAYYVSHRPVHDLFDLLAGNLRWAGAPARACTRRQADANPASTTRDASTEPSTNDVTDHEITAKTTAKTGDDTGENRQATATKPERLLRPHVRVHETAQHYQLIADLPGASRDTIAIAVENGELSLSAPRAADTVQAPVTLRYYRRFALPEKVDAQAIDASYDNGVLQLVIPKVAASQVRINVH
jgi:HSP20 family protein